MYIGLQCCINQVLERVELRTSLDDFIGFGDNGVTVFHVVKIDRECVSELRQRVKLRVVLKEGLGEQV
jgi:hypothetical protein